MITRRDKELIDELLKEIEHKCPHCGLNMRCFDGKNYICHVCGTVVLADGTQLETTQ